MVLLGCGEADLRLLASSAQSAQRTQNAREGGWLLPPGDGGAGRGSNSACCGGWLANGLRELLQPDGPKFVSVGGEHGTGNDGGFHGLARVDGG